MPNGAPPCTVYVCYNDDVLHYMSASFCEDNFNTYFMRYSKSCWQMSTIQSTRCRAIGARRALALSCIHGEKYVDGADAVKESTYGMLWAWFRIVLILWWCHLQGDIIGARDARRRTAGNTKHRSSEETVSAVMVFGQFRVLNALIYYHIIFLSMFLIRLSTLPDSKIWFLRLTFIARYSWIPVGLSSKQVWIVLDSLFWCIYRCFPCIYAALPTLRWPSFRLINTSARFRSSACRWSAPVSSDYRFCNSVAMWVLFVHSNYYQQFNTI